MAYLFEVRDNIVVPTVEALLISPFKEIWERDEAPRKPLAHLEFTYIEFMTSKKKSNPYKGYADEIRPDKIKTSVPGYPQDWEPDDLIIEGMQLVEQFQSEASETYNFYTSAFAGARKLQDFFNGFDMTQVNERNGNPIYKPKDITNALKDVEDVLDKLTKLRKKVEEDLFDKTVTKANKEISPFANPESMR